MPAPTEAGHAIRATRVGASEVGAIVEPGQHPFTTPADIYARIVHGYRRPVSGTRVRLGNDLEAYVARRWSELAGRKVLRCSRTYPHPDVALSATPDYYVPARDLLEVKVDRGGPSDDWADLPRYVYWQVVAQLACTNRDVAHVAALVGSDVRRFAVERDGSSEAQLLTAVHAFQVRHLAPKVPPQPVPTELTLLVAPRGADVADVQDTELDRVGQRVIDLRGRDRILGSEADHLRALLAESMARHGLRLMRGTGWTAEVAERAGSPQLVVRSNRKG